MKNSSLSNLSVVTGSMLCALFASCTGNGKAVQSERPNIIHIMTDDHAFQALSAYGGAISKIAPTPNIDRIAQKGMIFQHAYVENSISAPSRATLLTGLYSHKHGQEILTNGFKPDNTVFPELLQQAGYQTAIVGKWHLQVEPKGFDYYKILKNQGDYYNPEFATKETNGKYVREEGYATILTTDYAINWLDKRDKKKPFCLLVHHKAPHRNFMPESKYYDLYEDAEFPYPDNFFDDYTNRGSAAKSQQMSIMHDMTMGYDLKVNELNDNLPPHLEWSKADWEKARTRMTPEQLQAWDAAYGPRNKAMLEAHLSGKELAKWKYQRYVKDYMRTIKSVDDQIGRLLDYLEENKLMDNTIIVYTSDQGFYMGEHGWFDKRFMYEESFRTPLLIMYPKMIKAGSVCNELVQNIDYAPTYLALAGVESPVKMDGRSLVPLFSGDKPQEWRETLYYHYYDYPAIHMVRRHDGVSDGRYKLIHFYGEGKGKDKGIDTEYFELYDLQMDPHEMKNVYDDSTYKEHVDRLKQELAGYQQELDIADGNLN
ncbi:sulfatase family protein [Bacteroides oleiciplenus]|uniref:DUF4976 domain-containing protein n=1 Tax=Bacteroides oleiciplenus TaxID=626931 RepID=A0A3E5BPH7_9BACE|nr:sulfatase [Bacteroides oleiciplenus]RGN39285.1 DUF4976 domain-containing protein [Bacteroides oleiciplenus]